MKVFAGWVVFLQANIIRALHFAITQIHTSVIQETGTTYHICTYIPMHLSHINECVWYNYLNIFVILDPRQGNFVTHYTLEISCRQIQFLAPQDIDMGESVWKWKTRLQLYTFIAQSWFLSCFSLRVSWKHFLDFLSFWQLTRAVKTFWQGVNTRILSLS